MELKKRNKISRFRQRVYWYTFYMVLHLVLTVMAAWSHYICMITDPGYIPEIKDIDTVEYDIKFTFCDKCDSYRPIGSHHCKTCKRCILRMDHHCTLIVAKRSYISQLHIWIKFWILVELHKSCLFPKMATDFILVITRLITTLGIWVSNCVGKFNQKFFMQYLVYIILMAFFDMLLIAINIKDFVSISGSGDKFHLYYIFDRLPPLLLIFGCVAITFFFFCTIMLIDQLVNIYKNRTGIDKLQNIRFKRNKFTKSLRNICGNTFSEIVMPICNKNDIYWGKELTLMDIVALMSLDEFKLEEGYEMANRT